MDMRKCDVCGEYYSTTYRRCPFCEEEEAQRRGKPVHRRAGDFRNKRGGQAAGVILLLAVFAIAGLGVGHFFGGAISEKLGIRTPLPVEDGNAVTDPDTLSTGEDDPTGADPQGNTENSPPDETDAPDETNRKPDTAVMLSSEDFTLDKVGATHTLTVSGGGGSYTWSTADAAVASISEDGTVTAKGAGTTQVSVTDGYTTAVCTVRVKGQDTPAPSTGGAVKLNREDMTMPAGTTYQLKVKGSSSPVTWSIEDSSIATIDGDGTVHFLKKGTTTATAVVDGKTLQCIVRVKN